MARARCPLAVGVVAILLATSSNNLLKAAYVVAYSGGFRLIWPVGGAGGAGGGRDPEWRWRCYDWGSGVD